MSETDIANLALGRLGVSQAIANLSEQSTPARLCNRFYTQCRQEVLQAFPWGHASFAVALAEEADQTFPGWQYVYGYPNKALMVWAVSDESGIRMVTSYLTSSRAALWEQLEQVRRYQLPFKVALRADLGGRVLLSDMPNAHAFGTYDVTNTGVFPPDFKSVVAWRLAMEVGGPLEAKPNLIDRAFQQYFLWQSQAAARDLNERRDDPQADSASILARM